MAEGINDFLNRLFLGSETFRCTKITYETYEMTELSWYQQLHGSCRRRQHQLIRYNTTVVGRPAVNSLK